MEKDKSNLGGVIMRILLMIGVIGYFFVNLFLTNITIWYKLIICSWLGLLFMFLAMPVYNYFKLLWVVEKNERIKYKQMEKEIWSR